MQQWLLKLCVFEVHACMHAFAQRVHGMHVVTCHLRTEMQLQDLQCQLPTVHAQCTCRGRRRSPASRAADLRSRDLQRQLPSLSLSFSLNLPRTVLSKAAGAAAGLPAAELDHFWTVNGGV